MGRIFICQREIAIMSIVFLLIFDYTTREIQRNELPARFNGYFVISCAKKFVQLQSGGVYSFEY